MESSLRTLARFAVELNIDTVPGDVVSCAQARLLDNVSAGIAASNDPVVHGAIINYLEYAGNAANTSIWGHNTKAPLLTAVFINALMCHTLEVDDVHTQSKAHIGSVVIPAAWSLAEHLGASGKDLLAAIIVGYELESRIAMAFGIKEHRKMGWHVTSTAGVFGAAAACGKLFGFGEDDMVNCLALAGAQSFGTWAFLGDGCNCKALNPARAAASGCEAAILVRAGMKGPEEILTADDGGLFRTMTTEAYPEFLTANLGSVWEIGKVDCKTYPCCRSTHCAIDGILDILQRRRLNAQDIEKIVVSTYLIGKQQCATAPSSLNPQTSSEAKFSLPYCVAAALVRGSLSFSDFDIGVISDKVIQDLISKIEVVVDQRFTDAYPEHWGCHISVLTTCGEKLELEVSDASGSIYRPLSKEQSLSKAVSMISYAKPDRAEALSGLLLGISELEKLPLLV